MEVRAEDGEAFGEIRVRRAERGPANAQGLAQERRRFRFPPLKRQKPAQIGERDRNGGMILAPEPALHG